jgi:hypothetical protein
MVAVARVRLDVMRATVDLPVTIIAGILLKMFISRN